MTGAAVEKKTAITKSLQGKDFSALLAHLPGIEDGVAGMRMISTAATSNQNDGAWQPL